jgi:catalase
VEQERKNLIGNIVDHLGKAQKRIQLRQNAIFYKADPEHGRRVAEGLELDISEISRLAKMSQEERAKATKQSPR